MDKSMTDWSPWRKWWMDIIKSILIFAFGAIITIVVLNHLEDKRADERYLSQAAFQLRLNALDDFRRSTLRYARASVEAFTDLYQWDGNPGKTPAMLRYEQQAYQDFQIGVEGIRNRFPDNKKAQELLNKFNKVNESRHQIYDRLVDQKLDRVDWEKDEPWVSRQNSRN